MICQLVPVLASTEEVIIWAVVLVMMIGSWIVKQVKARQEQGASGGASGGASEGASGDASGRAADTEGSRDARLQELASRRREQLRQLAQQRGEQPTNLTAAQRTERSRARTLYERRAEALRRAQSQGRPAARESRPPLAQPVDPAQARRAAQGRAAAEAPAEAPVLGHAAETARRQREEQAQREQRLNALAQREQQQDAARQHRREQRDAQLGAGAREVVERSARRDDDSSGTRRIVTNADATVPTTDRGSGVRFKAALRGRSLRDAILLREIIGPPKSLRPDDELL